MKEFCRTMDARITDLEKKNNANFKRVVSHSTGIAQAVENIFATSACQLSECFISRESLEQNRMKVKFRASFCRNCGMGYSFDLFDLHLGEPTARLSCNVCNYICTANVYVKTIHPLSTRVNSETQSSPPQPEAQTSNPIPIPQSSSWSPK